MNVVTRIKQALTRAIEYGEGADCPPQLAAALRYAVFPGGARIRPRLCLAVAAACGDDQPQLTEAAASSIELLHCASLVHDDLPCFDDAPIRRGKPSVHAVFGERLAVLAGDALIVRAFEFLALSAVEQTSAQRLSRLLLIVGRGVGMPAGIAAGQAWECEAHVVLADYQRAKTGALFAAATEAGAAAAGFSRAEVWRTLGERLGEAYQVADDIRDATSNVQELGKPIGRDVALDRPSAVRKLGITGAAKHLQALVAEAMASIPQCPGADDLRSLIFTESKQFLPEGLLSQAA